METEFVLERNIDAIHQVRRKFDELRRPDQIFIDRVASFAGSTPSLYAHVAFYFTWILIYLLGSSALKVALVATEENIALTASLEAIFLAVFVLINQRRTNAVERKSSDLHLQMSLLSEHEITRLAQMVALIGTKLGVDFHSVPGFEAVIGEIHPADIISKISDIEGASPTESTSDGVAIGLPK